MILYQIKNKKAQKIGTKKFLSEKELQKFVENNLEEIFELKFVASEFGTRFSIDTIGFDTKTNSPVLIEFKENQSFSVIDQGFTYLYYILTHKGDLQLEIERKFGKNIKIDWSQSRIYFIARNFNKFQIESTKFKGLPISLIEYSLFENDIIGFNFIETYQEADLTPLTSKSKIIDDVGKEIKSYDLDDILKKASPEITNLFYSLREKILEIDNSVTESFGPNGAIYKNNGLTFLYIYPRSKDISGILRLEHQKNLRNILVNRDVKEDSIFKTRFSLKNEEEIEDALIFIKKALENTL